MQQATDVVNWTIDQDEFDDFLALKTDSAPGFDGFSYGSSFFLMEPFLEGRNIRDCFAESRSVIIPKTSDTETLEGLSDHLTHFAR